MRSRLMVLVGMLCAAWILASTPALAVPAPDVNIFVSTDELKKWGVNLSMFAIGGFARDGTLHVGFQKETNAREIARGHVFQLLLFKLDWAAKKASFDTIWLPLTSSLEQFKLSPDAQTILVIGGSGTKFIAVDVPTKTSRVIFAHEAGKPGFRCIPQTVWLEKDKYHVRGYFYDAEGTTTSQAVVTIDPAATGLAAFQTVRDITVLNELVKGYGCAIWYASDQAYFGISEKKGDMGIFAFLGDDRKLQLLDRTMRVLSMAVGQNRLLYATLDPKKAPRLAVYDVAMKKGWHLGDSKVRYTYVYMSKDGATVLACTFFGFGKKMTAWYGHDTSGFSLRPMPGMEGVYPGTIRLSDAGDMLAFFGDKGVWFRRVPKT